MSRDLGGDGRGLARLSRNDTPARAAAVVTTLMVIGFAVMLACIGHWVIFDTFFWSGTIGTLILLVVYLITTVGAIRLVFVQRKMPVPMWQVVIPIAAIVVLGYTIYRQLSPWPAAGVLRNLPLTAAAWIVVSIIVVLAFPGAARRLGQRLAADEGFATGQLDEAEPARLADA
jgi:hypothetical protein